MVLAAWAAPAWGQETKKSEQPAAPRAVAKMVRGRVVDEIGRPVAGIAVSNHWSQHEQARMQAVGLITKTDDRGQFQLELTFYSGTAQVVYALDARGKRGALAVVEPAKADEPLTLLAGPLVRVHGKYTCKELGTPVGWTNSMFFAAPARVRFGQSMSKDGVCTFLLPPGRYTLSGYGSSDVGRHARELTLTADKPDVDLGEIDLAASAIAKLKGKPGRPCIPPTPAA